MSTKRILIFTDWYAPAFKAGGPISSILNLVNLLHKKFEFYIVTGDRDLGESAPFEHIATNTWIEGENGEKIYYCSDSKMNKEIINTIVEVTKPNYIYYNSLFSINFTLKPLLYLHKKGIKSFLSPRGMLHPKAFSQKGFKKRLFVSFSQLWQPFKKLTFLATNEIEQEHITKAGYKNQVLIAPNIPDTSFFKLPIGNHQKNTITIVSRIAEEKNSIGALKVLAQLKEKANVNWFGEAINAEYEAKFREAIKTLPSHINLVLLGAQPKSKIRKELSGIFFLPTFGENFGHAIYEALAAGLPAVIGINTPFSNIEKANAGFAIDPVETNLMTEKLDILLSKSPEEYQQVSVDAKAFAKSIFNEEKATETYASFWS